MTSPGTGALAGRHAVVTGGGRGLGATIAEALAARGASVSVLGRERQASHPRVEPFACKGRTPA